MKPPAFQFYAADFLVGTAMMTTEEVGGYIRLLCYQWDTGGVPDDDETIMRLTGCQALAVAKLRLKFGSCGGYLKNARLEAERQKQSEYRAKQAENGKKRWLGNAKPDATAKPSLMPNGCSPSPSPSPNVLLGKEPKAIPSSRPPKSPPFTPEIPDTLSPALQEAFRNWLMHRAELKKPYKPTGWKAALGTVSKFTESAIIASIEAAMSGGWSSFWPDKFDAVARNAQNSTPKPKLEKAPWE